MSRMVASHGGLPAHPTSSGTSRIITLTLSRKSVSCGPGAPPPVKTVGPVARTSITYVEVITLLRTVRQNTS